MDTDAVAKVIARIDELGLQPAAGTRGWKHMGAVITDAALQAGVGYNSTVLPRARKVASDWPLAATTNAFIEHLDNNDIATFLNWKPEGKKLSTLRALAETFQREGVQTVDQLLERLSDETFRRSLRRVKGVGPKTVDYLSILSGGEERAAIDVHVRSFLRSAGVLTGTYDEHHALIEAAAQQRGWTPGALDAVIWAHQSRK